MPGPPPVIMKMMSNSLTASSRRKVTASRMIGRELRQRSRRRRSARCEMPVELRRLVEMRRDRRQARQQDDEHERRPLPDIGDDDGDIEPGNLADPADLDRLAEQLASR